MTVEMAQKELVDKARARPDLVKQVIQKAKTEDWSTRFRRFVQS